MKKWKRQNDVVVVCGCSSPCNNTFLIPAEKVLEFERRNLVVFSRNCNPDPGQNLELEGFRKEYKVYKKS